MDTVMSQTGTISGPMKHHFLDKEAQAQED